MKTLATVFAMLMAVSTLSAQEIASRPYFSYGSAYSDKNMAKVANAYLACLSSKNEGVVESALAHVAMMKLVYPAGEYGSLKTKVAEISLKASSAETRYKAFLTGTVLDEPGTFRGIVSENNGSADELFSKVASKMSEKLAAR